MPIIEITPKDPLLFRDGKPFTAGSSHSAESVFPPKPSVFAGFIRSKIFTEKWQGDENKTWEKVQEQIGIKHNNYGKLNIKAVFIKHESDYYIPAPLDIVKEKRESKYGYIVPDELKEFKYSTDISDKIKTLPFSQKEINFAEQVSGFISIKTFFEKYLTASVLTNDHIKSRNDFVESEPRVGIAVGSSYTAKEGQLYTAEFLRFKKDAGFAVLYEGVSISGNGDYFIGGEKRQVSYSVKNNFTMPDINNIKGKIENTRKFKVVLITPSELKGSEIEPSGLNSLLKNNNIVAEFKTAVIRTEPIGGWDIAENKPKPMKRYYTAGCVFYYELKDGKIDDLLKLNFETISEKEGKIGFGRILIGVW